MFPLLANISVTLDDSIAKVFSGRQVTVENLPLSSRSSPNLYVALIMVGYFCMTICLIVTLLAQLLEYWYYDREVVTHAVPLSMLGLHPFPPTSILV